MLAQGGVGVHGGEKAAGQAGEGDDGGAAGGRAVGPGGVVAGVVVGEDPGCGGGVEDGVEGDEVGFFGEAPGVFVFFVRAGWCGVVGGVEVVVERSQGAPDRFVGFALRGAGWGCRVGVEVGPDVLGVGSAHFGLDAHHLLEVFPGAVDGGDVEAGVAFPEALAGLGFGPLADAVEEMVPMARVAGIHF